MQATTRKKERGIITRPGMSGFLCPPTHPEHTLHVEYDLWRRPENRSGMSLFCAATDERTAEWLDAGTITEARRVLAAWDRPPIERDDVQDWIRQVLGYFRGCYRGTGPEPECWNADKLSIVKVVSGHEMDNVDEHAGVRLIRRYYPEFAPTVEHFTGAYWGTKPETL